MNRLKVAIGIGTLAFVALVLAGLVKVFGDGFEPQ